MDRNLQEVVMHTGLSCGISKNSLLLDYCQVLRDHVVSPLVAEGTQGVDEAVTNMGEYCLLREDLDGLLEVTQWPDKQDPLKNVDSKTKAVFIRKYKKKGVLLPYSINSAVMKEKGGGMEEEMMCDDEEEAVDSFDNIMIDKMTAMKKPKSVLRAGDVSVEETNVESAGSKSEKIKNTGLYCGRNAIVDEPMELKNRPEPKSSSFQMIFEKFVYESHNEHKLETKNLRLEENCKAAESFDVELDDVDLDLDELIKEVNEEDFCQERREIVDDYKTGVISEEEIELESLSEEDFTDESRKIIHDKSDDLGEDLELASLDEEDFLN